MDSNRKLAIVYALSLGTMAYSANALINPHSAVASICCSAGSQCAGSDFCCSKSTWAACDPIGTKTGYCLSSCS